MLTLFTTALGFLGGFAPKVMDYFIDKQDKAHELAMLKSIQEGKVAEARVVAEGAEIVAAHREQETGIKRSARWMATLSTSVRPVLTYLFAVEFLVINWAIAYLVLTADGFTIESLQAILDEEFFALLSSMIAFYFTSREIRKREGR